MKYTSKSKDTLQSVNKSTVGNITMPYSLPNPSTFFSEINATQPEV
jgi:hypothetical protein